jgi:lambda family phage portal protein
VRGVTWFHAIIIRNATFHRFQDAAVTAAEIGASKIAALEREMDAPSGGADQLADSHGPGGVPQISVEGGEMFELPPGYKLSSWNPEYPHANFESFVKTCFYGLAAGLDVANHNLSGNMEGVNYSSARIAEMGEREIWMLLQDWFIANFVRPVYEEWLSIAMLKGAITFEASGKALPVSKLDKFLNASRFQGRRWSWVDPQKEMEANRAALDMRITSRTRIAAERGESLEDVLDELAAEEKLLQGLNLAPLPQAAPPVPPPPPPEE